MTDQIIVSPGSARRKWRQQILAARTYLPENEDDDPDHLQYEAYWETYDSLRAQGERASTPQKDSRYFLSIL